MQPFMPLSIHWRLDRIAMIALAIILVALSMPSATRAANGSVSYSYDALGRLLTANYDTGVCIVYSYDANGNRTSQQILVVSGSSTGVWGCFNWNGANWGP
jgi:YD repeat-containing protein